MIQADSSVTQAVAREKPERDSNPKTLLDTHLDVLSEFSNSFSWLLRRSYWCMPKSASASLFGTLTLLGLSWTDGSPGRKWKRRSNGKYTMWMFWQSRSWLESCLAQWSELILRIFGFKSPDLWNLDGYDFISSMLFTKIAQSDSLSASWISQVDYVDFEGAKFLFHFLSLSVLEQM